MRPRRLQLSGFASFREATAVDFDDADYLAFVGPTGSGKSSLIDAIVFALYGTVPRYEDRRVVWPIVSQGKLEARVALDFEVRGCLYRAVRVVRLTKANATTPEARLERLDPSDGGGTDGTVSGGLVAARVVEVLAGDAKGVTEAVERLLGLTFEHFTKCVVLPQGAFARFLYDKPADRQDLLKELLGLGVYDDVGRRANLLAAERAARVETAREQLAQPALAGAQPEAAAAHRRRVETLQALQREVADAEPRLDELSVRIAESARAGEAAAARVATLEAVRPPEGVEQLAQRIAEARGLADRATGLLERSRQAVADAHAALAALPARLALEQAERAHATHDELLARLDKGAREVAGAVAAQAETDRRWAAARALVDERRLELDAARHRDAARELAHTLAAGDTCPVCQQAVDEPPPLVDEQAGDQAVNVAAKRWRDAEAALAGAAGAQRDAAAKRAGAEAAQAALQERQLQLAAELAAQPDAAGVVAALEEVGRADAAVTAAVRGERAAAAAHGEALAALAETEAEEMAARRTFDRARDGVAVLGPPPPAREDLAVDWKDLVAWAADRVGSERAAAAVEAGQLAAARAEWERITAALVERCGAAGVDVAPASVGRAGPSGRRPADRSGMTEPHTPLGADGRLVGRLREHVAVAITAAQADLDRVTAAMAEVDRLRALVDAATGEAAVAHRLGQHLRADHFERWLLDELTRDLVAAASEVLRDLSQGAFTMTVDERRNFGVIDHHNAGAARLARSLSGGETFLASLALALALADRLAGYASEGSAPLDAIFLDEGFGSLDQETLETVAVAMESLAATGRMVGLVTHVRELAERVPIRFEVDKGATTATVTRVDR
jgi:exonuclease SbcC